MKNDDRLYNIKCPIHRSIDLFSNRMISVFVNQVNVDNESKTKPQTIEINSPLFFCKQCKKLYISSEQIPNSQTISLGETDNKVKLINYQKKIRKVQDAYSYDNSIFALDSKALMNGICKVFKWNKFTIDYSVKSCTEDGYNLIKTGKLVMNYHDIINDASVRTISCNIYSCPKCNRVYIKNNLITFLDYRVSDISKIKTIKVLDNNNNVIKKTENPFYIDEKVYKSIKRYFTNSIEKHTGYTSADIEFSKYVISTCKYDKTPILRDSKLVLLEDNSNIILGGCYCPRCHRLYFNKNDFLFNYEKFDIENKKECPVRISIYNPIKKNREEFIHTIIDNQVSYLKKYKKEFGKNLIIRCLIEERKLSELSSVLKKYNYSFANIDRSYVARSLNEDIKAFFELDSFNSFFDYEIDERKFLKKLAEKVINNVGFEFECDHKADKYLVAIGFKRYNADIEFQVFYQFEIADINNLKMMSTTELNDYSVHIKVYSIKFGDSSTIHDFAIDFWKRNHEMIIYNIKKSGVLNAEEDVSKAILDEINNNSIKLRPYKTGFDLDLIKDNVKFSYMANYSRNRASITAYYNNSSYSYKFYDEGCGIIKSIWDKTYNHELSNKMKNHYMSYKQEHNEKYTRILNAADFIVRSTDYYCIYKDHQLIPIQAVVPTMSKEGIIQVELPAYYCEKCNRYYVLEKYYKSLKSYGYICCRVDTFEALISPNKNKYSNLKEKSVLMAYGYTVNSADNLSEEARHDILILIISNGIMSKQEIISFLEWQIDTKDSLPNMSSAISKWEKDIRFVRNLQDSTMRVLVKKFTVPIKTVKIQK